MPDVGVYDLPSGGAFGYTATDDPTANSATHHLNEAGATGPYITYQSDPNLTNEKVIGTDDITLADGSTLGVVHKRIVHLSASDILTLNSSPFVAVPAPGANKVVFPHRAMLEFKVANAIYTMGGSFPVLIPLADTQDITNETTWGLAFFDNSVTEFPRNGLAYAAVSLGSPPNNISMARSEADNQPLVLTVSTADPIQAGGTILTFAVANGGAGYSVGNTGTINTNIPSGTPTPIPAQYHVVTAPGGVVGTVTVTNFDPSYEVAAGYATTVLTGGGNGALTIDVNSIHAPDGDLYLTTYYTIETVH